ncbi:Rhodanese-like protein [Sparassis latifolia]
MSYGDVVDRDLPPVPTQAQLSDVEACPQRTLEDVREQAAQSVAVRAIRKSELVDDNKVGVVITLSHTSDERFLGLVASAIKHALRTKSYLFALTAPSATPQSESPLLLSSSSDEAVQRAGLLVCSKFLSRVVRANIYGGPGRWIGSVRDIGSSSYDDAALWDVVRKAARRPIDPLIPPPSSRSVDQLLSHARARLQRITPQQAYEELHDTASLWPVVLVDIRPEAQRIAEGGIHGSLLIERNVLEWRFDPRCAHRLAVADRYDLRIIIFCQEGYASSLAAASLHDLGMLTATDIIGGYAAWRAAGLPSEVEIVPISRDSPSIEPDQDY